MTSPPARHRRSRARSVLVACVVGVTAVTAAACTVDGAAEPATPDLTSRSVVAADFPGGTASRVPTPAVAGAIGDLIGRPLGGTVSPPSCTPPEVPAEGAVIYNQVRDNGSLTSAVVTAPESLGDTVGRLRSCTAMRIGTVATSDVAITMLDRPRLGARIATGAYRRTISTGGGDVVTTTTTMTAQRGRVRVYVEFRSPTSAPASETDMAMVSALHYKAVRAAFG